MNRFLRIVPSMAGRRTAMVRGKAVKWRVGMESILEIRDWFFSSEHIPFVIRIPGDVFELVLLTVYNL